MSYYVYILTTRKNTVLYTGVTGKLESRIGQHKQALQNGFTRRYNVNKLVCLKEYTDVKEAIHREKCIKKWKRDWKIELIEGMNPSWADLFEI